MLLKGFALLSVAVLAASYPAVLNRKTAAKALRPYVETYIERSDDVWFHPNPRQNTTTENLKELSDGLGALARLGYMECKIIPAREVPPSYLRRGYKTPQLCEIIFTERGNQSADAWEVHWETYSETRLLRRLRIPVAVGQFVAVTGIREENRNLKTVLYTFHYKPFNDIGEQLVSTELQQGAAFFRRFDDGWRIVPASQIY